ncbi:kelch-like protein 21 [Gigantopelta aegis]|uniref:kelch-like protein 21 n=1 Tax=Gigantopelta aegis TaxID=1735272 RepID=UPI001B88E193|nr:kelch-like protein 21 [Gigantopelta aegis]
MKPKAASFRLNVDMEKRGSETSTDQLHASYLLYKQNYSLDLLKSLNVFRSEASFTDAILCVGHEEFPCHRNVLAVSSPYFMAMFTSDLKESRNARICFSEVSPWTLKRIIDFAYSGRLEITPENAQEMLAAGNLFQYPDIVSACCEFLEQQLHPSNCLGIENFAQMHSCDSLQQKAIKFTEENFSIVVECDEFVDQPLERIIQYISSDFIDVRTEETVYDAVMRWIKFDPDERDKHLPVLLQNIRLPVLDISSLHAMAKDPCIRGSKQCLEMIQEAQLQHESISNQHGQRRCSMQSVQFNPRPSTVAKEVMVVVCGINSYITKTIEMYDPQKEKWSWLPDFPQLISWFSVATVANSIFVTGGICDGHIVSEVWKFDVVKRKWTKMPSMPTARAKHASVELNDCLYVLGGMADGNLKYVEDIECYNPVTNSWTKMGHTYFPRKQSQVVTFGNTLVEMGGLLEDDVKVKTIVSYLCADNGVVKPAGEELVLPDMIQFCQVIVINSDIYIMWEDTKKVIALNTEKQTFRHVPDMHYAHLHCGATVLHGKIYVSGGLIDSKPSTIVECYDPQTNSWTIAKPMQEPRAYHGFVTIQMC